MNWLVNWLEWSFFDAVCLGKIIGSRRRMACKNFEPQKFKIKLQDGGRARFFYQAVAKDYSETSEIVAFCDVNQTRMDFANSRLEELGAKRVPTYKHYEFDKMIEEIKPDYVIVTSVDRTHDDYIIRAMELGCDVITEKPMIIDEKMAAQ